jgi:site-specific DNA-methyltransferase (adenine-specific)
MSRITSLPAPYYQDSAVTIYHGDCRELLPQIAERSVDMVLMDPPYGHNNNNGDLIHRWEEALGLVKAGRADAGEARPISNDGPEANELVRWSFNEIGRVLRPRGIEWPRTGWPDVG